MIDVNDAKAYMSSKVNPVLSDLVRELAMNQPENVLRFIRDFADRKLGDEDESESQVSRSDEREEEEEEEQEDRPVCCMSGFEADYKQA